LRGSNPPSRAKFALSFRNLSIVTAENLCYMASGGNSAQ
jgi:hypothetical protein